MARFLLECPHTDADCVQELDSIFGHSEELFVRFDWGCKANEHVGWAIVEAGEANTARMLLPAHIRARARVIQLNKFTPDDVRSFHLQR